MQPRSRSSSKVITWGSLNCLNPSVSQTITLFRWGTLSLNIIHLSSCSSFSTKKNTDSELPTTYSTWGQALVAYTPTATPPTHWMPTGGKHPFRAVVPDNGSAVTLFKPHGNQCGSHVVCLLFISIPGDVMPKTVFLFPHGNAVAVACHRFFESLGDGCRDVCWYRIRHHETSFFSKINGDLKKLFFKSVGKKGLKISVNLSISLWNLLIKDPPTDNKMEKIRIQVSLKKKRGRLLNTRHITATLYVCD